VSVAVAGAVLLAGCRVDTRVSVVEKSGGAGTVRVTVAFDPSAVRAFGGQPNLAKQLQYSDLEAAGWTVSGPTTSAGGGASVTATHGFSDGTQLEQLMSALAGSGPGPRPFRLSATDGGGFWTHKTVIRGAVDLRCGLECFGDPGLQSALGGSLGVAPQPLEQAAGEGAAQVFTFSLAVRLAGHADSVTGHPSVSRDGTLTWSAPLGQSTVVGALSESVDWGHVILVAVLATLVLIGGGGGLLLRRRRRRRLLHPGVGDAEVALPGESAPAIPGEGI